MLGSGLCGVMHSPSLPSSLRFKTRSPDFWKISKVEETVHPRADLWRCFCACFEFQYLGRPVLPYFQCHAASRTAMPHFQFSPPYDDAEASPSLTLYASHREPQQQEQDDPPPAPWRASGATSSSSSSSYRRLVTLSPDGQTLHALSLSSERGAAAGAGGYCCIETCRLPLTEDDMLMSSTGMGKQRTITELPDYVKEALAIDAPVELVCVEGESRKSIDMKTREHQLCLYTKKGAFLVKFAVPIHREESSASSSFQQPPPPQGKIMAVTEPLERHLEFAISQTSILRIRPAPRNGVTLTPPGSFAVLTENKETCEYTLLLHHADGSITTPLQVGMEEAVAEEERLVDFCFAHSSSGGGGGLGLFPALSVLLLTASGDVLAASPVVLDRTVVPRPCLDEARDYLQEQTALLNRGTAKWRQCRGALQFLADAFVGSENRNSFATAQILNMGEQSATSWPLKLQGPILFRSSVDPGPPAVTIETFGSSNVAAGIAIGKQRGCIDFAMLAPTGLLPRFTYESRNDAYDLDDILFELGALVERVDLGSSNESGGQLVRDPIVGSLLHYATPTQVFTVSTNAMNIASRKLKGGDQKEESVSTTAWICLNSSDPIQGIVVPDDPTLGHELIALLRSGKSVTVDITESKYLHEFESRFQFPQIENSLTTTTMTSMSTVPFYSEVQPLVEKINTGLSSMGRIVGSETSYKDITPDTLAVALRVKKRCDDQVVLPILELKKLIAQRRQSLAMTLQNQQNQLKTVLQSVQDLKTGLSTIGEKMERAEANASQLSERSVAILQASRDLLPTITQAEYDYFQDMKRLNLKVTQLEKEAQRMCDSTRTRCEGLVEATGTINGMSPESVKKANVLLKDEAKTLQAIRGRLDKTEERTAALVQQNGISTTQ